MRVSLAVNLQNLDLEQEAITRANAPCWKAASPIAFLARDVQPAHLPQSHSQTALIPTGDDLGDAGIVGEGLLSGVLGAPELLAALLETTRLPTSPARRISNCVMYPSTVCKAPARPARPASTAASR